MNLDKKQVVLEDIISRETKALKEKAREEEIALNQDLGGPNLLEADPERISQVVRNLVDNAITHTPKGGEIKVKTRKSSDEVVTTVSDDGSGIPEEDLPYIFDRFYRVDKSRSRGTGGTGLGLTIAKEIVESHGGNIKAKSSEGTGSTFEFALPLPG